MKKKLFVLITIVVGLLATASGRFIWVLDAGHAAPSSAQLPFLIVLDVIQSALMGAGFAMLFLGWSWFASLPTLNQRAKVLTFLSSVWLMISWWPHIGFHMIVGENFWGLIAIDYGFHLTVIAASMMVIRSLLLVAKNARQPVTR